VRFEVVDWENYATIGVGRPQELITAQTLERFQESLALVIGIMGQRFGSPTGKAESGTEEEFNWALESHRQTGFPEIKWFFRRVKRFVAPPDPSDIEYALEQWRVGEAIRRETRSLPGLAFGTTRYNNYRACPGGSALCQYRKRRQRRGRTQTADTAVLSNSCSGDSGRIPAALRRTG